MEYPTMSVQVSPEQLQKLSDCLLNVKGDTPLHERFRALFTLKAVGGDDVVEIVSRGFADPSALLKHELAYVLGQIKNLKAVPHLEAVLIDADGFQGEMVRHEAAEALGALSSVDSLELLKKYKNDESRSVRETCEIAVDKIEYDHFTEEGRARQLDPNFPTTDPAPASLPTEDESASSLRSTLLDTSIPLFKRYRAMFALRNIVARSSGVKGKEEEAKEGVRALADGFKDGSALFRHEIAYIFGQLSSPYSIPSLLYVMRDSQEDDMVRHEAAEALGGIASEVPEDVEDQTELYENEEDRKKGVLGILREWSVLESAPPVVRESCQVALDMYEYENSNQFQYADGLNSSDSAPVEQTPAQRLTGMDRGVDLTSIMA